MVSVYVCFLLRFFLVFVVLLPTSHNRGQSFPTCGITKAVLSQPVPQSLSRLSPSAFFSFFLCLRLFFFPTFSSHPRQNYSSLTWSCLQPSPTSTFCFSVPTQTSRFHVVAVWYSLTFFFPILNFLKVEMKEREEEKKRTHFCLHVCSAGCPLLCAFSSVRWAPVVQKRPSCGGNRRAGLTRGDERR